MEAIAPIMHVRRKPQLRPLSLLVALIRKNQKLSEDEHKKQFRNLLNQDGYIEFVDAVIDEWLRLNYGNAAREAMPPTVEEIKARAAERRRQNKQDESSVETAKAVIASRLLDFVMPNGKRLKDSTKAECLEAGGWLARIAAKVPPRKKVGEVLKEGDLAKLLKRAA